MFALVVSLRVKPERREEFLRAAEEDSRGSREDEPGCLRFDVHQQVANPTRFLLHEIYTDEDAFYRAHRSAPHYAAWRQVAERCVVPGSHVNTYCRPLSTIEEERTR